MLAPCGERTVAAMPADDYRARMVTIDEVVRLATDLPEVTTGTWYGNRTWMVGSKPFAWQRPLSKADLRRLGDAPVPTGPIFAFRVADLRANAAVLAEGTRGVFTIAHFDHYPAVLVQLDVVPKRALQRLVADAWVACVPPTLADRYRIRARKQRR